MKQVPKNLEHLFWDVKIETFNPLEYPQYTIDRVLEFGDDEAASWIKEIFSESDIKGVIKSDKRLSPKSANFWAIIYGLPLGEIAALKNNRNNTF
jgi:hypothetical protein